MASLAVKGLVVCRLVIQPSTKNNKIAVKK